MEIARIAEALGVDPIPRSRREARELIEAMRSELKCDGRTRQVARPVLTNPPSDWIAAPLQVLCMQAAIDLLPEWARRMHGLSNPALAVPVVRASNLGMARTLRWALK